MKYRYSVRYRRLERGGRVYRMTVTASTPDEARRVAAIRDPLFGSTTETPRRGPVRVDIHKYLAENYPEQADGMTAAKAREDMERGTAHFPYEEGSLKVRVDREFVEWRGTEVEVVD